MFVRHIALNQKLTGIHVGDPTEQPRPQPPPRREHDPELPAVRSALQNVGDALESLRQQRQQSLAELQQAAVELGLAIASQLVCEKLESQQYNAEQLVRRVLSRFDADAPVTVRLHPNTLSLIERKTEEQKIHWPGQLRLVADPSLNVGDCCAEGENTSLLAGIEQQLAELHWHLSRNLEDARTERR